MTGAKFVFPALLASLALVSCGGGGSPVGGGGATAPPDVVRTYTFPQGDATANSGAIAWDIIGVTTTLSGRFGNAGGNAYDTLRVDVTFAQNVANALPAPGAQLTLPTQLGVSVGLDTDGNASTGFNAGCNPSVSLHPFEFDTDQGNDPGRLADGNYTILENGAPVSTGGHNAPSEAMVSVAANVFSETFFLTAVGVHNGALPPHIGVAVAAGNGTDMNASGSGATDCVPEANGVEVFST